MSLLFLPFCDDEVIPTSYSSLCTLTRGLEAAGRSFNEVYGTKVKVGPVEESECSDGESNVSFEDTKENRRGKKNEKNQLNNFKLDKVVEGYNLYNVLEVNDGSTLDQIKQSYRRLVVIHHPDKKKTSTTSSKDSQMFLRIQAAFETLSDPERRKQYDSTLPFDESIPDISSVTTDESFFDVFTPSFARNSRWSRSRPVPSIGSMESLMKDVEKFYEFWLAFESTRDFSQHFEHDIKDSQCREEKRWMQRQNDKERRKRVLDEQGRILELVRRAKISDPRLRRQKEKEVTDKKKAKEDKIKLEEAKREAEKFARLQEEERLLKEKEDEKNLKLELKKKRSAVKGLLKFPCFDPEEIQTLLLKIKTFAEMEDFMKQLEECKGNEKNLLLIFHLKFPKKTGNVQIRVIEETQPVRGEVVDIEFGWSNEELAAFKKAIGKYPVGTGKRWEQVANFIGTRTVPEIVALNKRFAEDKKLQGIVADVKRRAPEADKLDIKWSDDEQTLFEAALRKFPSSTANQNDRWELIANEVPGKSREHCMARFKHLKALFLQKTSSSQS